MTRRDAVWVGVVVAATALAWCGFFVHNVAEFPGQTILSTDSLLPTLVWAGALVVWVIPATRAAGAWMLLAWAVINLVGGAISVLPLPFLPFEPEQTLEHYAFHGLYAATQLPLIGVTAVWLSRRARDRTGFSRGAQHGVPDERSTPSCRRVRVIEDMARSFGSRQSWPTMSCWPVRLAVGDEATEGSSAFADPSALKVSPRWLQVPGGGATAVDNSAAESAP